jgi:outer membrane protein OmpA-like peptidoglycan-associated protein
MGRSVGSVGVRAAIIGVVMACSMFGQAPELRRDLESLRHQAEEAAGGGDCATAVSLYRSAFSAAPDAAWARRGLADCYRVNGSWAKAADQYEAVAKMDSTDLDAPQLASLTRRAMAEQQEDVVKAETFTALKKFALSWPLTISGAGTGPAENGRSGRNLSFSQKPAAAVSAQIIPVQVAFPRNKWLLDEKATRQLAEVAASITSAPGRPESITVEGHTCGCGSVEGNNELGRKRAETVRDFLISKGVTPPGHITTVSYGSSRPVESAGVPQLPAALCERDAIHSENRRVVILLYGSMANPTPPPPTIDVSFLSRRAGGGSFELLPDGGRLRTGDEYMIRLRAKQPVYAYVFHRQPDGTWIALAPNGSTALAVSVEPGRDVSIPSPSAGFPLDANTGVEETIIYSRLEPDKDLETLADAIQKAPPDKGYVSLLPPDLPDLPKPVAPSDEGAKVGGGQRKAQQVQPREGTKQGVIEDTKPGGISGLPPAGSEGSSKPAVMKGLVLNANWPRLPADPVAFVRFNHLTKQGN